jgi:glutamate synthase (NADPH/NADH) small chain
MNQVIGKTIRIEELLGDEGFDAVFIGVGAGLPRFIGIAGENLGGVCSANEYLTRANLMKAYVFPEYDTPILHGRQACVIGGGNVAMDAARTARRLGSDVTIVYRRSRDELPARMEEVQHAEEEGIVFRFLTAPIEFLGNQRRMVAQIRCQQMTLGEPDDTGRRRPVPIDGDVFAMDADLVIVAIGSAANPLLTKHTQSLEVDQQGYIVTDVNGHTSHPRIWAGGDIVTGSATVIRAMGAGKKAAEDIHRILSENRILNC